MNRIGCSVMFGVVATVGVGCAPLDDANQGPLDLAGTQSHVGLPRRHLADAARASAGEAHFSDGTFARALVPTIAMRSLFYVWGGTPPSTDVEYWAVFRARYGFHEAPYDNDGMPIGLRRVDATNVTFDCRMCHADVVAGRTLIGAGNSLLDFQGLMDDLQTLANLATTVGFPQFVNPVAGQHRTGAAGATDAMGLGFWLSTLYATPPTDLHTDLGYQQPPPWWNLAFKDRIYCDASGSIEGNRTMMSMFLAFGLSFPELQSLDEPMEDLRHYLLTMTPPSWPYAAPSAAAIERGRAVFTERCASCHGTYSGETGSYPELLVARDAIATDPTRAAAVTDTETGWVNASWFGEKHPMQASGKYVAPSLLGAWATAPYLHNGSVPDLRSLLRSSERPTRWQRTGASEGDYDAMRVGWKYTTPPAGDATTIVGRRVYDTTRKGLGKGGHTYGDSLADAELADLLEYMKTL